MRTIGIDARLNLYEVVDCDDTKILKLSEIKCYDNFHVYADKKKHENL